MAGPRYDVIFETTGDRRKRYCNELHRYQDPGVLLGLWFEDRARIEAETEELVDKYFKSELPFQRLDKYINVLSTPVELTRNLDGYVHHGDIIRLKWIDSNDDKRYYIAALPMAIEKDGCFTEPCLASATEESRVLLRTAFHVFRNDNTIPNTVPLMYGERIQFCTLESTGHRVLHSEPQAYNAFAKQSKHQDVYWEKELSARAIWRVLCENVTHRRRTEYEGHYIPVNTNVVISHLATGQCLALEKDTLITTTFGKEKEISSYNYLDIQNKRPRIKNERNRRPEPENIWQIDAPRIKASDYVLLAMVTNCAAQSATKDNVPTPDSPPGTDEYVAPTPDVPVKDVAPDFTFAVWDANGKICILAKFTVSFQITYESTGGEQTVSVNLPEEAQAKGRCGTSEKEPVLELSWPGFRLVMIFTVATPKDSWELLSMELLYNTASPIFDEATNAGKKTARILEDGLFATTYGKSYFCPSPDVINMYDSTKERVVLTRMKDVRLQVYDVQHGKFSQFQRCSLVRIGGIPEPFAQDQTVPIAVGSTLAVVSVLVVIGYALWRNLSARKTEYDTME